ncbi:aminopeptidase N [Sphingomonas astaxanthinifaciens]|uniref:Aminopeptidase N n=1 Tax=Sphingomonas astaxanthinifaciens DSM 22298 TaxID=1123267 RepID=A0ABQ5Z4N6_9SPHN|nr:aminopeptidase N [Sphingomonas astaxanthinifaciens]GLR46610.1 aminopeptidase N [Sphingomonas astaxanthinifaciens DSM 22298]
MFDARDAFAAPAAPAPTLREDYRAPDWLVPDIALGFDLDPARTVVRARLSVTRNGEHDRPLRLEGEELELLSLTVDGERREPVLEDGRLVVALGGAEAVVETEVAICPEKNSQLMGLYASGGILCTQCEAEGFRRITYFPDRPDVLSRYRVRLTADKARYPVLLANGNPVEQGEAGEGRHFAVWEDPFPKPCYLFAVVAGDLACNADRFRTMSGREVALGIWVREADLPKTALAMQALKDSMAWDERTYGREYDLDRFNIVAVSDFNFGAMENKGLNIFNTRYVLADPETATDADIDAVAAVVAHEYFHNWSGNRVTCRDWFQLSLKEGLTVFRDQSFSEDMGSPAVQRIDQVRTLRAAQFPEDAGPLAHPIRPDSYLEIANFYTATVYNKGAEVIRMMRTLLGPERYRKGTDLYFQRHDGQAVTCEDFVKAMEDASGVDLSQFRLWYSQAGTPTVRARLDQSGGRTALHLDQSVPPTPGQPAKQPMVVPLKVALIGAASGREISPERLVVLREERQVEPFANVTEPAFLSINRQFSAPVIVVAERKAGEIEALAESDTDAFARYEAGQELMQRDLLAAIGGGELRTEAVVTAVAATLRSNALDPAFKADAIALPGESLLIEKLDAADPARVHTVREAMRRAIGVGLKDDLSRAYMGTSRADPSSLSGEAKGLRRLRGATLGLLAAADAGLGRTLAARQYASARTMTERQAALMVLAMLGGEEAEAALADFYGRYESDPLVIDKWFAVQASVPAEETLDRVEVLGRHPAFTLANPNRLRALAGSFAGTPAAFHRADGRGYDWQAEIIVAADKLNPQTAARFVAPLGRWRKIEPGRAAKMRAALERILREPGLSKDVLELAGKSLG